MPFHRTSSHSGANTPWAVPSWKTGSLTGAEPRLPTVTVNFRPGGAPNQVSTPSSPSSRTPVSIARRAVPDSAGSSATGWSVIFRGAATVDWSPLTEVTFTTHGQGLGGATTGSRAVKCPSSPTETAVPSALAQLLVPPIMFCPQTSSITRVLARQPVPVTVISVPLAASWSESATAGLPSAAVAAVAAGAGNRTSAHSASPAARRAPTLPPTVPPPVALTWMLPSARVPVPGSPRVRAPRAPAAPCGCAGCVRGAARPW